MASSRHVQKILKASDMVDLGFIPVSDDETCSFTKGDLKSLREKNSFSLETNLQVPPLGVKADFFSPHWVTFYEYPFTLGFSFPFPPLINDFFKATNIAYAQLMPNGWRTFYVFLKLANKVSFVVGLEELAYCYHLRGFGKKRFYFRVNDDREPLVLGNDPNDRGWKEKFFFAERETLEKKEDVPEMWNEKKGIDLSQLFPEKEGTKDRVNLLLALPATERTFKVREYSGRTEVVENQEEEGDNEEIEIVESSSKMSTGSRTTRSKGITTADVKSFLASVKGKDVALPPVPKMMKVEKPDSKVVGSATKKRKAKIFEDADDSFEGLDIDAIGGRFLRRLTDQASEMMKQACDALRKDKESLLDKAELAEKQVLSLRKEVKEKEDEFKKKVSQLVKDLKSKETEMKNMEETHGKEIEEINRGFMGVAAKTMLQTRIDMIEEYAQNLHTTWNVEEERATYKKMFGDDAEETGGEQAGEVDSAPKDKMDEDAPIDKE